MRLRWCFIHCWTVTPTPEPHAQCSICMWWLCRNESRCASKKCAKHLIPSIFVEHNWFSSKPGKHFYQQTLTMRNRSEKRVKMICPAHWKVRRGGGYIIHTPRSQESTDIRRYTLTASPISSLIEEKMKASCRLLIILKWFFFFLSHRSK